MTPTPRTLVELKDHARTLRWLMRGIGAVHAVLLLIHIWDQRATWAVWSAVVLATAIGVARDVTKTLERLR